MWYTEPPMGISDLWNLDLPGVFGGPPQPWRPLVIRQIRNHGQMERLGVGEDDGKFIYQYSRCLARTVYINSEFLHYFLLKIFYFKHIIKLISLNLSTVLGSHEHF